MVALDTGGWLKLQAVAWLVTQRILLYPDY
jgi:hypothetical protein